MLHERLVARRIAAMMVTAALTTLMATGCSDDDVLLGPGPLAPVIGDEETGIPGSGSVVTEMREVAEFDGIVFASEGSVDVRFGDAESVTIETDDNLLEYLETSVVDGVLRVETTESVDIAPTQPPRFAIEVVNLTGIEFAGAGSMSVDAMTADAFTLTFLGVGDLSIDDLTVDELQLTVDGVGRVRLGGSARSQIGMVDGVTDYDAGDLATATTSLEAGGTSTTLVWVTDRLTVTASGLAEVRYYGDPAVEADARDSATVTGLGDR